MACRAASSGKEQGADIDVEADISESGGDDFGAAIMPVLTQLTTNMRGRRPSSLANWSISAAIFSPSSPSKAEP